MTRSCLTWLAPLLFGLLGAAVPAVSHAQPAPSLLRDFYPGERITGAGPAAWDGDPRDFARVRGRLLFIANSEAGTDLWRTDGTPEGTQLLRHAFARNATFGLPSSYPVEYRTSPAIQRLKSVGDFAVLVAKDDAHGMELWRTDGTPEGTVLLKDLNPGPADGFPMLLAPHCGSVLFTVPVWQDWELWKTDGTEAGTVRLGILPYHVSLSLVRVGAYLFFSVGQRELWRTDGTEAGTVRLGTFVEPIKELTAARSQVYFSAKAEGDSYELWRSDGTKAGTSRVKDINVANGYDGWPHLLLVDDDRLFFRAYQAETGLEPWVTDGTEAGTHLLKDLIPGSSSFLPEQAFGLPEGRALLWTTDRVAELRMLWVTDGTEEGTRPLRALYRSINGQGALVGNTQVFAARETDNAQAPRQLWRTDGTPEGTVVVHPASRAEDPHWTEGRLLFWADHRMWTSDDGLASARAVVSIPPGMGFNTAGFFLDERTFVAICATEQTGYELCAVKLEPLPAQVPPARPEEVCEIPVVDPEPEPRPCGCAAEGSPVALLPGMLGLLLAARRRRGPR